jgi:hypothetical protein
MSQQYAPPIQQNVAQQPHASSNGNGNSSSANAQNINELDQKIMAVQNSTRTLLPFMIPVHDWLRQRSQLYNKWHLKIYANKVHWAMFGITLLGVIAGIIISYYIEL